MFQQRCPEHCRGRNLKVQPIRRPAREIHFDESEEPFRVFGRLQNLCIHKLILFSRSLLEDANDSDEQCNCHIRRLRTGKPQDVIEHECHELSGEGKCVSSGLFIVLVDLVTQIVGEDDHL
jgi:hypothetical protein